MCHLNTKIKAKNEKWLNYSSKTWSRIFFNCQPGKRQLLLLFLPHKYITFLMTTCILNHSSFIYGISWNTEITKKGRISHIGSLNSPNQPRQYVICSDEALFPARWYSTSYSYGSANMVKGPIWQEIHS